VGIEARRGGAAGRGPAGDAAVDPPIGAYHETGFIILLFENHFNVHLPRYGYPRAPTQTQERHSFSRAMIKQSLEHQRLCPITRQPLDAGQLVPNRQLQQATDHYRNHHMRLFPALRRS
jgi:hypothetical protein